MAYTPCGRPTRLLSRETPLRRIPFMFFSRVRCTNIGMVGASARKKRIFRSRSDAARRQVFFVGLRLKNVFDLVYDLFNFFISVEEMRANADARARTIINQGVTRRQFADDLARVRN